MMKKVALIALCALLAIPALALAAGKPDITEQKVYLYKEDSSRYTYVNAFAEIENIGDKAIEMSEGNFEVYDANGDVLDTARIYRFYPKYLEPGETCFVSASIMLDGKTPDDVQDYDIQVMHKSAQEHTNYLTVVSANVSEEPWYEGSSRMTTKASVIVTNEGTETVFDVTVAGGAYDAEGKLLFTFGENANVGVLPGNQVEFRVEIDETAMASLAETAAPDSGLSRIATIKAVAYQETDW